MGCEKLPERVLITGGSGLIGSALKQRLRASGIQIVELARRPGPSTFVWDAETGEAPPDAAFDGVNVVIHLAGTNIARRWTTAARRSIHDSRVLGTRVLAETIAALPAKRRPCVFISMSGISIYGSLRPDERLDERAELAPMNSGFLSDLSREWEAVTHVVERAGVRTVQLRTGMVLAREGGALKKMLAPFRLGIGGPMGHGAQKISWISLDDIVSLIFFTMRTTSINGPVNAVAPHAVSNTDFARALGAAVNRPASLKIPRNLLRLLFGKMAEETVLADVEVRPEKAMSAGFGFRHPKLDDALQDILYPPTATAR